MGNSIQSVTLVAVSEQLDMSRLTATSQRLQLLSRATPGDNGVLRWYPGQGGTTLTTAEQGLALASKQRLHLDALEEAGIRIPHYTSFLAEHPTQKDQLALFNHVDYITGGQKLSAKQHMNCLGYSLLRYTAWVEKNKQPEYLFDIFRPIQYSVVEGEVTLLDIEPRFENTFTRRAGHLRRQKRSPSFNVSHLNAQAYTTEY